MAYDPDEAIMRAKQEWWEASARGDQRGMDAAHAAAEAARSQGGTIGAGTVTPIDQYYAKQQKTPEQYSQYYEGTTGQNIFGSGTSLNPNFGGGGGVNYPYDLPTLQGGQQPQGSYLDPRYEALMAEYGGLQQRLNDILGSQMSRGDAEAQARAQLDPLYAQRREETRNRYMNDLAARGITGALAARMVEQAMGDVDTQYTQDFTNLTHSLIGQDRDRATQLASVLGGILASKGSALGSAADLDFRRYAHDTPSGEAKMRDKFDRDKLDITNEQFMKGLGLDYYRTDKETQFKYDELAEVMRLNWATLNAQVSDKALDRASRHALAKLQADNIIDTEPGSQGQLLFEEIEQYISDLSQKLSRAEIAMALNDAYGKDRTSKLIASRILEEMMPEQVVQKVKGVTTHKDDTYLDGFFRIIDSVWQ